MDDNRRKYARFDVALAAEVEVSGDTVTGETRDLSEGGVAVILGGPLQEGGAVHLALILTQDGIEDANEEPFETRATVVWAAPTEDGRAMMGLRFSQVAASEALRLKRFLNAMR
jgi:c-di-GMP-binding flagellar brake protein YcgR